MQCLLQIFIKTTNITLHKLLKNDVLSPKSFNYLTRAHLIRGGHAATCAFTLLYCALLFPGALNLNVARDGHGFPGKEDAH